MMREPRRDARLERGRLSLDPGAVDRDPVLRVVERDEHGAVAAQSHHAPCRRAGTQPVWLEEPVARLEGVAILAMQYVLRAAHAIHRGFRRRQRVHPVGRGLAVIAVAGHAADVWTIECKAHVAAGTCCDAAEGNHASLHPFNHQNDPGPSACDLEGTPTKILTFSRLASRWHEESLL